MGAKFVELVIANLPGILTGAAALIAAFKNHQRIAVTEKALNGHLEAAKNAKAATASKT